MISHGTGGRHTFSLGIAAPSGATPADSKRELRAPLRQARKNIPVATRQRAARRVALKLARCRALRQARRVAVYLSMGSELPTAPLIAALVARQIIVHAPVICRSGLRFRVLTNSRLKRSLLGMTEPRAGRLLRAADMDVVLLPLLGFDARGTRLGQGGGYYDRALARCRWRPYRLGLAYEQQRVERLPREAFDQPLDAVLTECQLHRFHRPLFG